MSDEMKANVLCFADVQDACEVTYTYLKKGLLCTYLKETSSLYEGLAICSRFCLARAHHGCKGIYQGRSRVSKRAYELVQNAGFPSFPEAVHLTQDGNIANLPSLTTEDL